MANTKSYMVYYNTPGQVGLHKVYRAQNIVGAIAQFIHSVPADFEIQRVQKL